jgi:hypothetical protein
MAVKEELKKLGLHFIVVDFSGCHGKHNYRSAPTA